MQNRFPQMQNVFPQTQNVFPQKQKVFPQTQNVFPQMQNVIPKMHFLNTVEQINFVPSDHVFYVLHIPSIMITGGVRIVFHNVLTRPAPYHVISLKSLDFSLTERTSTLFRSAGQANLQLLWTIIPPETFACTLPSVFSGLSPPS